MRKEDLVKTFYALSDPIRLGIVKSILERGELCVCQITEAFKLSQPNVSFHLRVLKEANILIWEKRGKWVYYRINPANEVMAFIVPLIESMVSQDVSYPSCEVMP
ncbi:MAG: ArsR/SmtB family transcription factor [Hydrogenobacter sp.]